MHPTVIYRPPRAKPFEPNPKAVDILRGLNRLFYLSPLQVNRRYWTGNCLTQAKAVLKTLADHGYAEAVTLQGAEPRGRPAYVYRLGPAGLKYLCRLDEPIPTRLRHDDPTRDHLRHLLAVNDLILSAELLARTQQEVALAEFAHDRALKSTPFPVTMPSGRTATVVPDAILHFTISDREGEGEQYVVCEVDMGAKRQRWEEKMEKYLRFLPAFTARYRTHSFTLAVATPLGDAHAAKLKLWTEQVFTRNGMQGTGLASAVFFTGDNPVAAAPEIFWLSPAWRPLFADDAAGLLEVYLG